MRPLLLRSTTMTDEMLQATINPEPSDVAESGRKPRGAVADVRHEL